MNTSPFFQKIKTFVVLHKILSGVLLFCVLGGAYLIIKKTNNVSAETRYVTSTVARGTIVSSITGTGQVDASNQVDLKPKASGDIVYLPVQAGQFVKAGTLIAELDTTSAKKAVRDAELNLENAQLSLQKTTQAADTLTITQAEDALAQAGTDLDKSYDTGFTSVANAYIDLPGVMTGIKNVLYGTNVTRGGTQDNLSAYADMITPYDRGAQVLKTTLAAKYQTVLASYNAGFQQYNGVTQFSATSSIQQLVNDSYNTTKQIADLVKSTNDFISHVKDVLTQNNQPIPDILTTHQTSLSGYINTTSSHLSDLLNAKNGIVSAQYSLSEKTQSLAKLQAGADPLDVQTSQLSLTQRQNALQDAQDALADYYVYAPFDGTIASVNAKKGDSATSGTSVVTYITSQQIAEVSLNEIDVAKVKTGDKVTLTFDAVPDLSISGTVAEIDAVGTVSQGVVTYDIKIGFDTQDERVKPGMTVTAAIITSVKQNVLMVPNSAVKTQGGQSYVEMFAVPLAGSEASTGAVSLTPPEQKPVEVGLSSNTSTEIISGLNEGDEVVTRTVTPTTKTTTTAPSLIGGGGGGNRGFGGGVRIGG